MQIRINKLISETGLGSRREIEAYIRDGRILINGKRAALSDKVGPNDTVLLDDVELPTAELIREVESSEAYRQATEKSSRSAGPRQTKDAYVSPKSASLRSGSKNNPEAKRRYKFRQRANAEGQGGVYAELSRKSKKTKR